jgi:hypothetical protein
MFGRSPEGAKETNAGVGTRRQYERDARAYSYFETAANNGECSKP